MIRSLWIRSLKNHLDRRSSTLARRVSGPGLESLEDRRLPALVVWINPLGGDWDTGSNWSSGSVPGLADQAVIALSDVTVTHSQSTSDRVGSLICKGTFELSAGSLAVSNPSIVNALILDGGTFSGPGALTISTSFLWTQGTLNGGGQVNLQGTLTLAGSGNMVLSGTTLNNYGTALWSSGNLTATENATFNNLAGATFIDAARGSFGAILANNGTLLVQAGKGAARLVEIVNTGTVDLQRNALAVAQYVQTAGVTDLKGGTLSAAHPVQINGGTLYGPGLIKGSLVNGGLVSVVGFGVLGVTGQYAQTQTGVLQVAVDGQTPANGFGQLQVSGPATLAGSLNVEWRHSPTTPGQAVFPVVTFTSRTGTFANLTVTSTTVPPTVTATYSSSAVTVGAQIVLLPGGTGTSVPPNPIVPGKPSTAPTVPQGSTETLPPAPVANGLFLASVGGGGAFLVSGSQTTAFGILVNNREVTLGSLHEQAAFGGCFVASTDDWGARDDDWQESLFTLPDDWELPSDKDLLVSADLAGALLLGATPRADLLPQKGSEHASVATLLPGDGAGEVPATARVEEAGKASLKGLLTNPIASAPDDGELPPLPQGVGGAEESGDVVAYSWGQFVWAGVGWLGWQRRRAKADRKRKKHRWVALG